jgi:hypothetical protein
MGRQEGFEKFLANDVSAVELENRLQLAKDRVLNANPEIAIALSSDFKAYYGFALPELIKKNLEENPILA